jgi:hypothetical protein
MGIGNMNLQFALLGRRRGVRFDRTMMLGRQNHFLNSDWVKLLFERFDLPITEAQALETVEGPYAEALFKAMGAAVVESMDASDYEGASVVHDLNVPVPAALHRQFTCVLDCGTLEHVFNFPVALKSAVDMIEVGGHFLAVTPTNNFMGHGFYQFSPELYFNFLAVNGFTDIELYLQPYRWVPQIFRIADPREVHDRVELVNPEPMQMGVIARKAQHIADIIAPIQSDYHDTFWSGRDVRRRRDPPRVDPQLAAAIADLRTRVAALNAWPETLSPQLMAGLENGLHYQLIDPAID